MSSPKHLPDEFDPNDELPDEIADDDGAELDFGKTRRKPRLNHKPFVPAIGVPAYELDDDAGE